MKPIPLHPARQIREAVKADVYEFEGEADWTDFAWIAERAFRYGSTRKVIRAGRLAHAAIVAIAVAPPSLSPAPVTALRCCCGTLDVMLDPTLADDEALVDDLEVSPAANPRAFTMVRGLRAARVDED